MEIIKRGVLPSEKLYRGRCRICESVIEASHDELNHTEDQRDGSMHYGPCPLCENRIYFEEYK